MSRCRFSISILVLIGCLTSLLAATRSPGPGITVTYANAIEDTDISIYDARLPNGVVFPNAGGLSGGNRSNDNPLIGGATIGAAPDGRNLPDYIDFKWRESPKSPPDPTPLNPFSQAHKDWKAEMMRDFYSHPIKEQRIFIRNRIPAEVVNAVIKANHQAPKGQLDPASIHIYFIWTDYGIRLRWEIWHRTGTQYDSHQGGDELIPAGTTMIAAYSSAIKGDKFAVDPGGPGPDGRPRRYPASASGSVFSGSPSFAYTKRPFSGGEKLIAFENESTLPEWVEFNWALLPTAGISPKLGESDTDFHWRSVAFYSALPRRNERVLIRSRIPQEVQDEIGAASRNAQPHKSASSVIYLYFIWTESGIKLHWRLKRSQPDGRFISVREGGDELT